VCKRELEIRNFVPVAYFEVVATAKVAEGQFQMRHAPQDRIVRREIAEAVANAARDFEGALAVRVEDKRQGPPKLHDLPSLQKLCGSRFGWPAGKTLEVAQELYDGQGKKIITYNLDENGAAIRMRARGRDDRMIALSLGRREPFFTVLSCDCRLSLATGPGKLQVQPPSAMPRKRPECCIAVK
jgi:hypothetical protein